MFHPSVVERRLNKLADSIRKTSDPKFNFTEHSIDFCHEWVEKLDPLYDPLTGSLSRPLTDEENTFILHEIYHSKADFNYWARRYAKIKTKNMDLVCIQPTAVQTLLLERIAKEELASVEGKTGDGILFNVLKARQLGVSTISDIIITHRSIFYANTSAIIASDIDTPRTLNLYNMVVRVLDNLPWWMLPKSADPKRDYRVKNGQLYWHDQDSIITFAASNNMQGGASGMEKGSMGTGMTLPLVHLSELALWTNPGQIDDALMPSIPLGPRTFAIFESTAKGRGNWWHDSWEMARKGIGRRKNVFIGWYLDPNTYRLPAPLDWTPLEVTLNQAEKIRTTSPRWVGHTITPTRDQLFWWEQTLAEYKLKRELPKFLAEYTADDQESFQNTDQGAFPIELIMDLQQKANKNPVLVEIKPRIDMFKESHVGS